MIVHLRAASAPSGAECGSTSKRMYLTSNPDSADCKRCRKARGLGAFDDLAALRGLVVLAPPREAVGQQAGA